MTRPRFCSRSAAVLAAVAGRDAAADRLVRARRRRPRAGARHRRLQRLALPPHQLRPGGHRRPPTSCASWGLASAARRCSAFRCSSSGRTRTRATSRRPTTCRATPRSTTTRSPTPTSRARTAALSKAEQARFDPMITGFNPADMYGVDHIRRVLKTFPGVFTGIGEFSIHKEFVSCEGRRRNREPHQPGARSHPRVRRRVRPRRHPPQRHRHAVREDRRRAGVPRADEGAAARGIRRPRSSGRTSVSAASSIRCRSRRTPPSGRPPRCSSSSRC